MEIILKYFNNLSEIQKERLESLFDIYSFWNSKVNLISRNDIENLYERHVLYSLLIAKVYQFKNEQTILDVGTGGGFPGIPLSILFPDSKFYLIDSINKKIKVVKELIKELNLKNVTAEQIRVEELKNKYNFIVSRAVTNFPDFINLTINRIISDKGQESGIFYLKGGEFQDEIKGFRKNINIYNASNWFEEEFFETKKLIFLSL